MKRKSFSCLATMLMWGMGCSAGGPSSNGSASDRTQVTLHPNVATQHNDNARTGANLEETLLTPDTVARGFGKLFSLPIRGSVYAQPLYVPNLDVPGKGRHNAVLVATMHNVIYAFDADDPNQSEPLWERQLEPSVPLPDPIIGRACGEYKDISGEVGIAGTPVVNLATQTMYLVTATGGSTDYAHYLHAVDIATGADTQPPVRISASVDGSNPDGSTRVITFQSQYENQRSGLLLANGRVYVSFGAYCDTGPYYGWIFGYEAHSLARAAVYNAAIDGKQAGIWMAGQGPAADSDGNLYVVTGNGTTNLQNGGASGGTAFLKLSKNLRLVDWFVPFNYERLNAHDDDLGSSGVMLVPDTNLVIGGGKESKLYVLDRANLGQHRPTDDNQVVQSFFVGRRDGGHHHIHGGSVYWNGPQGRTIYIWPEHDNLKAYRFNGSTFDTTPTQNTVPSSPGMPGGMLSISANGAQNGIVWASHPYARDANQAVVEGELRAYDAADIRRMLWSSKQNANRDNVGNFAKFVPPTVANGKLYMPTLAFGAGVENQVTFGDTSRTSVALANMADSALAFAWHGTDALGTLNVATSLDALKINSKVVLWGDATPHAPALAYGGGKLHLAWTGLDGQIKIKSSSDGRDFEPTIVLTESSKYGPALAYGHGKLYLAWTGADGPGTINVASSSDGKIFTNKVVRSGDSSSAAPALAFFNDTLYLLWTGSNTERNLNLLSSSDGVNFGNKLTLADTSDFPPALTGEGSNSYLVWTGRDVNRSVNGMEGEGTAQGFTRKVTYPQQALAAPSLTNFHGQLTMAWAGTDGRINLARLNPDDVRGYGRLNVYGPLPPSESDPPPELGTNIVGGGIASTQYSDSPSGENVTNAFDRDHGTKWLTFHDAAWIQYEFPTTTAKVLSYGIASGNDVPSRDPRDFRLEGSNDGNIWVLLDQRIGVGPFAERNKLYRFSCQFPGAHKFYRLTTTDNNGDWITQLSELELYVD